MHSKINTGLIIVLFALVAFLFFRFEKLNQRLGNTPEKTEVSITPIDPGLANPPGASPFDKPNVDPLADQFPPNSAPQADPTSMKFDREVHDFGRVKEGEIAKTVFRFTNTGKKPLIISSAMGSCGCTVPSWPKEPVKPGETGEIKVEFNSEGKKGENEKTVTVNANTNPPTSTLIIKSTVIPKEK